jgi:hypothetical protein
MGVATPELFEGLLHGVMKAALFVPWEWLTLVAAQ